MTFRSAETRKHLSSGIVRNAKPTRSFLSDVRYQIPKPLHVNFVMTQVPLVVVFIVIDECAFTTNIMAYVYCLRETTRKTNLSVVTSFETASANHFEFRIECSWIAIFPSSF